MGKETNYSARRDKKKHVENLPAEAKEAAQHQVMRTLYRIKSQLVGGFRNVDTTVKDKGGKPITEDKEKLNRWKEHFERVLNREEPRLTSRLTPIVRQKQKLRMPSRLRRKGNHLEQIESWQRC